MGARQSKRLDITTGSPKKDDVQNGVVSGTEDKLEKIEEGETVAAKVNTNGSTTSTVTAEQQEAAAVATSTVESNETPTKEDVCGGESTPVVKESSEKSGNEEIVSSPSTNGNDTPSSTEILSGSESPATSEDKKSKNKKKKWSFRSFSFSKKDKQKPGVKEEQKQDPVPEVVENEQEKISSEQKVEETTEQISKEIEQSEEIVIKTEQNNEQQQPPPLPSSPPPTTVEEVPVEPSVTPVESTTTNVEVPVIPVSDLEEVATSVAEPESTSVETPVESVVAEIPEKVISAEKELEHETVTGFTCAENDVSGAGEQLAEPLEEGELDDSILQEVAAVSGVSPKELVSETTEKITPAAPITNGTSLTNGTHGTDEKANGDEKEEPSSPVCERVKSDVDEVTAKIDTLKLQAAESIAQSSVDEDSLGELNGIKNGVPSNEVSIAKN